MYAITKLKTFVNPSHVDLEKDFNAWSTALAGEIRVVNTTMSYSAALQKYVLALVYSDATNTDQFQAKV